MVGFLLDQVSYCLTRFVRYILLVFCAYILKRKDDGKRWLRVSNRLNNTAISKSLCWFVFMQSNFLCKLPSETAIGSSMFVLLLKLL